MPATLDVFFRPKSVAVIGATEKAGHIGRSVLWNLISSPFGGTVYPVNSGQAAVLGVKAYPSIKSVPDQVDLAVIAAASESVPQVIEDCAAMGVSGAVILSSSVGGLGKKIRVIGPKSLGVMCPISGLNATFAPAMAPKGSIALVSQSNSISNALVDWGLREQVGFSAVVSVGSMLDVGWGALIDYLGEDPHTRSLVIYMESISDARSFLSAAREVALDKPILVIKAGRTESMSDAVLDAAFRRVGVLRIDELGDIFHMTEVLARQPRPFGPRLTIITNAHGPGILAKDAITALGSAPGDPIDISEDAGAIRFEQAVRSATSDPATDGVLVIMATQPMSDPVAIAEKLALLDHSHGKPILASWMGGDKSRKGEAILNRAGIPTFPFPETAVRAFHYMWRYSYNLQALYETPALAEGDTYATVPAAQLIAAARQSGRESLTRSEIQNLFGCYGIETVGIAGEGHRLFLGSHIDPQFGPVLLFGTGGPLAEVFHDRALALPPLNTTLARRFMEQTRISTALGHLREGLERLLVRFSQLVLEQNWIREIEIDPLFASSETLLALEAHVALYPADTDASNIPQPAIRPYPSKYADQIALKDGTMLDIRPVRPEDEPKFIRFHATLSDQSVYQRYFLPMSLETRIRHERLARMCFIDYDREMALVGERCGEIIGIARLIKNPGKNEAEIAFLVSDAFQKRGIGSALVQRLIQFARDEKLGLLTACFLAENKASERLFRSQGFSVSDGDDPSVLQARLQL